MRPARANREALPGNFRIGPAAARAIVPAMTEPTPRGRYQVAIHRAAGCYFARVLELPGCFSRGATEVEALENAREAIRAYLWMAQKLAGDDALVRLEISP